MGFHWVSNGEPLTTQKMSTVISALDSDALPRMA